MSDWSKTRSLASKDVAPNHMMSCVGGFSGDRDPSLDVLLDTGYSDLDYMSSLDILDSGLFLDSMVEPDSIESSQDFDVAALERLNLHSTNPRPSNIQNGNNIGSSFQETTISRDNFFLNKAKAPPNLEQMCLSQHCTNHSDTFLQGCSESTNSQGSREFAMQLNVETTPFNESYPYFNKPSGLPAEKSSYQQPMMYSFNSTPATEPLSRKWTPRKRRSPFTGSSKAFKTQKIGTMSSPTKRSSCNVTSSSDRPDKGKEIAQVVDPQEAVVSLLEQSIPLLSEFSQRKATAILSQLKQLYDDERKYGKPQDNISNTSLTSTDSISQDCLSDSETVDSDGISENTSISSTPRQPYSQESVATGVELLVQQPRAKHGVKPLFHCTFGGCNSSTHSSSDWKRHEEGEKHWPQKRSMCLECPTPRIDPQGNLICEFCSVPFFGGGANARAHYLQCMAARENGRTFARQDHLIQHLREKHSQVNIMQVAAAGEFSVISRWPRQCGFCGEIFESWTHRIEHIGQHYKEGANISSWKLPFPRPKGFHPSGSAHRRKDEEDDSSDDDFDGNNGPWLSGRGLAHLSHNHRSSGIRTSNGHSSSSQSSNSRSRPISERWETNSDQTLQTRLLPSEGTSSIPTFNANSVRGAGSLLGSLEDPILAKLVDRSWGDEASFFEHNCLRDNVGNKEAKPAPSEASLEADIIFALDLDHGDQVGVVPNREALFGLQFPEELQNLPSFCDANNDNNIDDDVEYLLRNGPTKLQTRADVIPWTAGTEGFGWPNSHEAVLMPAPGPAYNKYYLSTKGSFCVKGCKKFQRIQKLFVDSRPNERMSLTLQRYLSDSENPLAGKPDTGSERMVLAADQVFSTMTKNNPLPSQSHLIERGSKLRRMPSWGDRVVVDTLVKESPLAIQARDFIFKHRKILREGIFWMHSNIDPGLKDSFLDISIRSIEQQRMNSLAATRFLHIWSRNFCESLSSRSRCIGELPLTSCKIAWFLNQCMGLASALHKVHRYQPTHPYPVWEQVTSEENSAGVREVNRQYGRHGDFKPNVLWFAQEESNSSEDTGYLVIADFGLTDLMTLIVPPKYEPLEDILGWAISRVYDIWSLGLSRRSGLGLKIRDSLPFKLLARETACARGGRLLAKTLILPPCQ